jgi:DNA-binding transcriptional ArsR family regulator
MAGLDERRRRERRRKGNRQVQLIRALDHDLRRAILRTLNESKEPMSPNKIAKGLHRQLTNVSYHVGVLRQLGAVTEVAQGPVRGALEHFYSPTIEGNTPILTLLEETREADEAPKPRRR